MKQNVASWGNIASREIKMCLGWYQHWKNKFPIVKKVVFSEAGEDGQIQKTVFFYVVHFSLDFYAKHCYFYTENYNWKGKMKHFLKHLTCLVGLFLNTVQHC